MTEFSENYQFELPNFNVATWHDAVNGNFTSLDALIFALTGFSNFVGAWTNSTNYTAGQRVTDDDNGTLWNCLVDHTSSASGSFTTERTNNPTYWSSVSSIPNIRGQWENEVVYTIGDTVYDTSEGLFGIANTNHESSASPDTMRDDVLNWDIIFDSDVAAGTSANLISFSPTGGISGTDVQTALAEVDSEATKKASNLSDLADDAIAFGNIKQAASNVASGVVELATDGETETGTDNVRAVTPANVTASYIKKSLLTTRGDLIRRGSASPQRVALGTKYQSLLSDGSDAVWGNLPEVVLETGTIAAAASKTWDLSGYTSFEFKAYKIKLSGIRPATDAASLQFRTDSDAGASVDTGASDYAWIMYQLNLNDNSDVGTQDDSDNSISLSGNMGNAAAESGCFEIIMYDPTNATHTKLIEYHGVFLNELGELRQTAGGGVRQATAALNGAQILFSSGNIAEASYTVIGVR